MTQPVLLVKKGLLLNCLNWFQEDFKQSIVSLLEIEFPKYPPPREVQSVLECWEQVRGLVDEKPESVDVVGLFENQLAATPGARPSLQADDLALPPTARGPDRDLPGENFPRRTHSDTGSRD